MTDMVNLGKATVKVKLLSVLPNIVKDTESYDFDATSSAWDSYASSPFLKPFLLDHVEDTGKRFSAIFPSKRKFYVDNHLADAGGAPITNLSSSEEPYLLFKPTDDLVGQISDIVLEGNFDMTTLIPPPDYPDDYDGPRWEDAARDREAEPNEDKTYAKAFAQITAPWEKAPPDIPTPKSSTVEPINRIYYLSQNTVKDGLWWGLESVNDWPENAPFWVTIDRSQTPTTRDHSTFFMISLGIDSEENAYDILFATNEKPKIFDYPTGRDSVNPPKTITFENELSKLVESNEKLEMGIMTIAGRLVVSVNNVNMVYTRTVDTTDAQKEELNNMDRLKEAKIAKGKIRIYGSNCQVVVNVSPMSFAPRGALAIPIGEVPVIKDMASSSNRIWHNIDEKGVTGAHTVCKLPKNNTIETGDNWGIDCQYFRQEGGEDRTSKGFGTHNEGVGIFVPAKDLKEAKGTENYHVLILVCTSTLLDSGDSYIEVPYGGAPYFYRLKGAFRTPKNAPTPTEQDISPDVLSVSESFQIDDYWAVEGSAQITLYNEGGRYDYLKYTQKGVRIYWGWNGQTELTLTGLIVSADSSEIPGKEEITLQCHDYMFILKNTQMFNSPYYDGMILYYACKDLIQRAGVVNVFNGWDETDEYFLPAGYSFTKPAIKFDDNMMIYDCVKSLVERAEAFFYFDKNGDCYVRKLYGGLFSEGAAALNSQVQFVRDPAKETGSSNYSTILDTKNIEYDYSDTVNRITIYTLDRDTRDPILHTTSAQGSGDMLVYRRLLYIEQPAYGKWKVASTYADMLSQRAFYPIKKTSFKCIGKGAIVPPLSFVKVDNDEYRITGVSRKYTADTNEFITEYNAEWLGGK